MAQSHGSKITKYFFVIKIARLPKSKSFHRDDRTFDHPCLILWKGACLFMPFDFDAFFANKMQLFFMV